MIRSANPITIGTAIVSQDLAALFPNFGSMAEVKIINAAQNPLQVTIGADLHWIDAWGADKFPLNGAKLISFNPIVIASPAPGASAVASLLLTVASTLCEIPGTYPATVDRALSATSSAVVAQPKAPTGLVAAAFGTAITSGSDATLVNSAGSKAVSYWGLFVDVEGAAGTSPQLGLTDTQNGGVDVADWSCSVLTPRSLSLFGYTTPSGSLVSRTKIHNYDSVSHNIRGVLVYSIA